MYQAVKRYEVPVTLFRDQKLEALDKENEIYSWELKDDPFGIVVKRRKTNTVM